MANPTAESTGFCTANDRSLCELVSGARRRLVFVAPGVSQPVAEAIAEQWQRLGKDAVSVVLDADADVYRLGYGEPEGLACLRQTARLLGGLIRQQPGLRVGVVVADDRTLVYAPTPLIVEEAPEGEGHGAFAGMAPTAPNGVLLGAAPAAIEADLGLGGGDPAKARVGSRPADEVTLKRVEKDLAANPPQRFDVTRKERVFNARLEFVELELLGASIQRKHVRLPEFIEPLLGEAEKKRLMSRQFTLLADFEVKKCQALEEEKKVLLNRHTWVVEKWGRVLLRANRSRFERELGELEAKVAAVRSELGEQLRAAIERNKPILVGELLPVVMKSLPERWEKYGHPPSRETLAKLIGAELEKSFGSPDQLAEKLQLRCVFKGITYDTLKDPRFSEAANDVLAGSVGELFEEHDALPEQ